MFHNNAIQYIFREPCVKHQNVSKKLKFDDITVLGVQPLYNVDENDNDLIQK